MQYRLFCTLLIVISCLVSYNASAGSLSCSITTAAGCTGIIVLRMSSSTNAHAEIATGTTPGYANNVVCCGGVSGLGNSCSTGVTAVVLRLASTSNSHVQISTQTGYTNNACLSVPVGGTASIAYQANNCTGYDTTLASVASTTNSQIGSPASYTTKICGTAASIQSLTFSISNNTVSFGDLSPLQTKYASSTVSGDTQESQAHTITVSTNGIGGYALTVLGQTLTSQQNTSNTITALGAISTTPALGVEQFGLRATTTSGSGIVLSPYNSTGFAYTSTATSSSQLGSGSGDSVTSIFSIRYVANISGITEAGIYSANLTYVVTANY